MGYEQLTSLDCETTISMGGLNKKTGKPNPTQVEGYYLGTKKADVGGKINTIYIFATAKGNVGVWEKTNLKNKMTNATLNVMTKVTQSGMQQTKNNPMYLFQVAQDKDRRIEGVAASEESSNEESDLIEEDFIDDEQPEEPVYVAPTPPAKAAVSPSAARRAQIEAMAAGRVSK